MRRGSSRQQSVEMLSAVLAVYMATLHMYQLLLRCIVINVRTATFRILSSLPEITRIPYKESHP
jgi:hypothetical protein